MSSPETLNYSNIPPAPFSENIKNLIEGDELPPQALNRLQTLLSKYRLMENSLRAKKTRTSASIAEIEQGLSALAAINIDEENERTFELGDTMYARATIPKGTSTVGLWLGAGVMLEYPIDEAKTFLEDKMKEKKDELEKCTHDLEFIRRQITTMEVNIARLYNYVVQQSKNAQHQ